MEQSKERPEYGRGIFGPMERIPNRGSIVDPSGAIQLSRPDVALYGGRQARRRENTMIA